jgi:hypothetical protein
MGYPMDRLVDIPFKVWEIYVRNPINDIVNTDGISYNTMGYPSVVFGISQRTYSSLTGVPFASLKCCTHLAIARRALCMHLFKCQ